ncbi:hypothetical protein E2C01_087380 [Portunus trituberculatus]|uniref:Uncharacterized protein n=1 Tax=Portunus trituberculatus TaxID=210409 RepID=A0A5B7J6F9_PORTR|nr:hypothetical protein [Portunus trituberculatus]
MQPLKLFTRKLTTTTCSRFHHHHNNVTDPLFLLPLRLLVPACPHPHHYHSLHLLLNALHPPLYVPRMACSPPSVYLYSCLPACFLPPQFDRSSSIRYSSRRARTLESLASLYEVMYRCLSYPR